MNKQEIINHLNNGGYFENEKADYQFVKRNDGLMLEFSKGQYKFYTDINKFANKILKTIKG